MAVTKTMPVAVVQAAREAGLEDLAENYAKDLAEKSAAVPARWHFVGKVQAGTARLIADHADVIHSAEPGRALERAAGRLARAGRRIPCLLQVDFTRARQGVPPEEAAPCAASLMGTEGIHMVGLMTIPPWADDPEASRPFFIRLRELRDAIATRLPEVRELSMGMSGDYPVAVEEGATMVRIGTALFGSRPPARRSPRREGPGRGRLG